MFKCNCGREFEKKNSLSSHARFCSKYEKIKKKTIYKIDDNLYKCECGREFNNSQSLNGHFSYCLVHRKGKPSKRKHIIKGKMAGWDNFSKKKLEEIHKKSGKTFSKRFKEGKIKGWKGKKHSKETKQKMSESASCTNNGYVKTKFYKIYCPYEGKFKKVQGSWELKYAQYLNKNNILWTNEKRIKLKYKLSEEDYWHTYYPDFYLIEKDEYIEIKGHWWKSEDGRVDDKRKMEKVKEYNKDKKITIITKILKNELL